MMATLSVSACKDAPPPETPRDVIVVNAVPSSTAAAAEASSSSANAVQGPATTTPLASSTPAPKLDTSAALDTFDPAGKHTCAELKCPSGPTSEGMSYLVSRCKNFETALTAPRFQRFIQCMLKENNTQATCDARRIGTERGCMEGWAKKTEIVADTASACAPVVKKCGALRSTALSEETCQRMLSSVKPSGRKKMVACATEYCIQAESLCGNFY
jgi:hypothetical protein